MPHASPMKSPARLTADMLSGYRKTPAPAAYPPSAAIPGARNLRKGADPSRGEPRISPTMAQLLQIFAVVVLLGGIGASLWFMAGNYAHALMATCVALGISVLSALILFALATLLTWVYNIMLRTQQAWRTGK